MASLTGSWLAFRLGVDPARIESMRRAGELYAERDEAAGEWRYPSWQFDSAGKPKPEVTEVLETARADRTSPRAALERKVGLIGGRTVKDLLLDR
jgi:hypothetical protein